MLYQDFISWKATKDSTVPSAVRRKSTVKTCSVNILQLVMFSTSLKKIYTPKSMGTSCVKIILPTACLEQ